MLFTAEVLTLRIGMYIWGYSYCDLCFFAVNGKEQSPSKRKLSFLFSSWEIPIASRCKKLGIAEPLEVKTYRSQESAKLRGGHLSTIIFTFFKFQWLQKMVCHGAGKFLTGRQMPIIFSSFLVAFCSHINYAIYVFDCFCWIYTSNCTKLIQH